MKKILMVIAAGGVFQTAGYAQKNYFWGGG